MKSQTPEIKSNNEYADILATDQKLLCVNSCFKDCLLHQYTVM